MKIQRITNDDGRITDCKFILSNYTGRVANLIMSLVAQDKLTHGYACEYTQPDPKGPVYIDITNGVVDHKTIENQEYFIDRMKKQCSTEIEKEVAVAFSMLRTFKALKSAGELSFLEGGK